jgi:uncharacterized protein (DUF1778 family)
MYGLGNDGFRKKNRFSEAASMTKKTLTESLLDSGLTAAFDTLADRRVVQLVEERWQQFIAPCMPRPRQPALAQPAGP